MTLAGDCPSEQTLIDFASSQLNSDSAVEVGIHLQHCRRCAVAVDWIKCHLLRPRDDEQDEELTGIGIDSVETSREEPEDRDQQPDPADFDLTRLPQSLLDGGMGRLGDFDILGVLGYGGMGVVLRAWDERLRRHVAIKVLKTTLAQHAISRQRFLREARAAAAIHHPHVVTIHAVGEFESIPYCVMELVPGRSLRQIIRSESRLGFPFIVRMSEQIASALAAAHSQQILHRDIKPGNFLVDEATCHGKLTDFGLARRWTEESDLTVGEVAVGTPAYMAPEQVAGESVDYRADLFGLGCFFYEMVAGRSPFKGRGQLESVCRLDSRPLTPLHELRSDIPLEYSRLVTQLLEADPARRRVTAAEVVEILRALTAGGAPTPLVPQPEAQRREEPDLAIKRPRTSTTSNWICGAAISVALVLLGSGAWWLGARDARITLERDWAYRDATRVRNLASLRPAVAPRPLPESEAASRTNPRVLSVSQEGAGDFRTIEEALRRARPGSHLVIRDDHVYEETLTLAGPSCRNLVIESPQGATLAHSSAASLLTLHGVHDVTISGLRFAPHARQHACEILAPCPGTRLENLSIRQPPESDVAAVLARSGAGGSQAKPLVLRRSYLEGNRLVEVQGDPAAPVTWFQMVGNKMVGGGTVAQGAALGLHGDLRSCEFRENSVTEFRHGVEWFPSRANQVEQLSITMNCFFACDQWLVIGEPFLDQREIAMERNLVARVSGLTLSDEGLARIGKTWFFDNVWEIGPRDASVDRGRAMQVAELRDHIPFLSRDLGSTKFLLLDQTWSPPEVSVRSE